MKKKLILLVILLFTFTSVSAMEVVSCGGLDGVPYKLIKFVGDAVKTVQILVPIILIVLGSIDFAKAMTANDDKKIDEAKTAFVKRLIYAVLVFFVVAIVQFLFGLFEDNDDSFSCASCMVGNKCNKSVLKIESVTPGSPTVSDENKKVSKVKITGKKKSMAEKETFRITVAVYPDTAKNRAVTYKSSKTSVARISAEGKITALKKGKTTITVTSKDNKSAKASFTLEVTEKSATNNSTEITGGSAKAKQVVEYALEFVGKSYVYGGTWNGEKPYTPTDCSGFVKGVYKHFGVTLPRTSGEQSKVGKKVASVKDAQPGDLIFYGSPVSHVAMYMGDNKVVHASNRKDGIKISANATYRNIAGVRRILK